MNLSELLQEAQRYGNISLYQSEDCRTFCFSIEFSTMKHIKLEASSGFGHNDIESAVIEAIRKAVLIVDSMRSGMNIETERTVEILRLIGGKK